jgi:hypothetical protein
VSRDDLSRAMTPLGWLITAICTLGAVILVFVGNKVWANSSRIEEHEVRLSVSDERYRAIKETLDRIDRRLERLQRPKKTGDEGAE